MPYEDDDLYTHRNGHWRVLPRGARVATIFIGLPAWVVFAASIFRGEIGSSDQVIAFAVFCGVGALQGFFIIRAYWKMDL